LTYLYDGDGRRVGKAPSATPTQANKIDWYGMGSDPLDETDLAGNTNNSSFNEYIFFGGQRIARRDFQNNVNYYFADHLGTARIVANSSGVILDDSDFYPFGAERPILSSSGNNYKFTGKELDSESGLDEFGARYYSSAMGRFMTPDWAAKPIAVPYADFGNPQSLNLYSYVGNNPLSRADADGHEYICIPCIVQYIAAHAAQVGIGIQSTRREYNAKVSQATTEAGRDAAKIEARGQGPALGRAMAEQAAQDPARVAARAAKTEAQIAESITRTNAGVNATAEAMGVAGKAAGGLAVGISVYNIATAPEGEKGRTAAGEAGGLGGAVAGGEVGAEIGAGIGSVVPGLGTAVGAGIGGIVGAIVGGNVGNQAATQVFDDVTKKKKPEDK
jgi:RHS repeat-associated protein